MKSLIKEEKPVFIIYLCLIIVAAIIQLLYTQPQITLFINGFWNQYLDFFFKYITFLGDGYFAVLVGLVVMIKNRKLGFAIIIAYTISALITQLLKHTAFSHLHRPTWVLKDIKLHVIEGVELFAFNSFPSGHSTSVFALATTLALHYREIRIRIFILITATLVCISRVYLLQHFFSDIFAGSFIGFSTACVVYLLIFRRKQEST